MADKKTKQFSASEKLDYYKKRAVDPKLSDKQRKYAVDRINSLQSGSGKPSSCSPGKSSNVRNSFGESKTYTVTVRPNR